MSRQDASTDAYLRTRHRHAPLYRRALYRHVLCKRDLYRRVSTGVPLQACLHRYVCTDVVFTYVRTNMAPGAGIREGEGEGKNQIVFGAAPNRELRLRINGNELCLCLASQKS